MDQTLKRLLMGLNTFERQEALNYLKAQSENEPTAPIEQPGGDASPLANILSAPPPEWIGDVKPARIVTGAAFGLDERGIPYGLLEISEKYNGGKPSKFSIQGMPYEVRGAYCLHLPSGKDHDIIQVSHQQEVYQGLPLVACVMDGHVIRGSVTYPGDLGEGWFETAGNVGKNRRGHGFRRLHQGGPLEVYTMQYHYAQCVVKLGETIAQS